MGLIRKQSLVSTSDLDRHGAFIVQKGINTDSFLKNPIVLFNHDHNTILGKAIDLTLTKDGLEIGGVQFHDYDQNDSRKEYEKMFADGILQAFSVGILIDKKDLEKTEKGLKITKSQLYEISLVTVPANGNAVVKYLEQTPDGNIIECNLKSLNILDMKENEKDLQAELLTLQKTVADLSLHSTDLEAQVKALQSDKLGLEKALQELEQTKNSIIEAATKALNFENDFFVNALKNAKATTDIQSAFEFLEKQVNALPPQTVIGSAQKAFNAVDGAKAILEKQGFKLK